MSWDYWAELKPDDAVDPTNVDAVTARYHWLIASSRKRGGDGADSLRSGWAAGASPVQPKPPTGSTWEAIAGPAPDLHLLPPLSFYLQLTFTLAKPYLSRDDNAFYIIDNPIVRDRVYGLPMVRPTAWKGNLHAALWQLGRDRAANQRLQRLFGETRGDEEGQAGRLRFFPTFFTRTGLEVINPHDRDRRVGKNPILLESVPVGASGTFTVLYAPLDRAGEDEWDTGREVADDLQLLAEGVRAMMTVYGFSAKRSSGFGVAEDRLKDGALRMHRRDTQPAPPPAMPPAAPPLPAYLEAPGRLKPEYLNADGTFRVRAEQELQQLSKRQRQQYERARGWWEREGQKPQEAAPSETTATEQPAAPTLFERTYESFAELVQRAAEAAAMLRPEVQHER